MITPSNYKAIYKTYTENNGLLMSAIKSHLEYLITSNSSNTTYYVFLKLINNLESISQDFKFWSENGTPFFIAKLSKFFFLEESETEEALFDLFFLFLDSYFVYLKPFKIDINIILSRKVYLTNSNFNGILNLKKGVQCLEKYSNQSFLLNGEPAIIEKIALEMGCGPKFLIGTEDTYRNLFSAVNYSYLSPAETIPTEKTDEYLQKLCTALATISTAYPEIYFLINQLVKFYIPLKDTKNYSTSFSLRPYIGVVFLSFNTDILAISENIIREYGKNILHLYTNFEHLVESDDFSYYSPYSENLSTAYDLLSNIFIFIIVIEFFSNCLLKKHFENKSEIIKYRFNVQVNRLNLAFLQIKKIKLSEEGNKLVRDLYESFLEIKVLNKSNLLKTPKIIYDQLKQWKKNHPGYFYEALLAEIENISFMEQ